MQGVDLSIFQFDYDLTWAGVFLNADGTIYARYGGRAGRDPMEFSSLEGLEHAMERVLEIHSGYPKNKRELAGKKARSTKWKRVKDIPSKYVQNALGKDGLRQSCVHCHMIHDADHDLAVRARRYDVKDFYRYPSPERLGLTFDVAQATLVTNVEPKSPADKAKIRKGDVITHMEGQLLVSIADMQWALHGLPNKKVKVDLDLLRDGKKLSKKVQLGRDWKAPNLGWRVSMYNMPPNPGLWVEEANDSVRKNHGIADDKLLLEVRGTFDAAVQRVLRKGDLIVSRDGDDTRTTGGEFHAQIRIDHFRPGSKLELEVLRDKKREKVTVRF